MSEIDSSLILTQILGDKELTNKIKSSKILLVGAGGIGSEVIKDLLLMGFTAINVIDLDTIDVSNLNRQFLFNRLHVGLSKAQIAVEVAVKQFGHNSDLNVKAIHNSIQSTEFDIDFFKSHTLVINALDNRAARSHVNRMCLAADVPLIESGSEGYMGQVFLIKKDVTQCYECEGPKQDSRSFASCTIRNTPSLAIHCIVWAKHLFAQLFGEEDADNDVSPDMNDPELATGKDEVSQQKEDNNNENNNENNNNNNNGSTRPQSTRLWAQENEYNTKLLFDKLFKTDIEYLLRMDKLWESRQKPIPLNYNQVLNNEIDFNGCEGSSRNNEVNGSTTSSESLKDQRLWSISECLTVFDESLKQLKSRLNAEKFLVWDKDDDLALNFVTAVSNLRSYCFHINRKSKFDVKSMAGNIIPAISSTNSIVGGLITLQCLNVLRNLIESEAKNDKQLLNKALSESCQHIYLRKVGPSAKNLISAYELQKPNPDCLVCCSGQKIPEIEISCALNETTISDFIDQIIFAKLHFACPDIQIDGQSTVLWSKEDFDDSSNEEKERIRKKLLSDYSSVKDKTRFRVYDLLQSHTIIITLRDTKIEKNENDGLFYKMVITKEGEQPIDEQNDQKVDDSNVETIKESVIKKTSNSSNNNNNNNKSIEQIDIEIEENGENMIIEERKTLSDVEEVTISDSDSDSDNPVIIDDDSVDIIEVREKRKIESDVDNESVIKKVKS